MPSPRLDRLLFAAVIALAAAAWGQPAPPKPAPSRRQAEQALVDRFSPSSLTETVFLEADLNGTGRKEFLVAVYYVYAEIALRVLKMDGGSASLAAEAKNCIIAGMFPEITLVDLDRSTHPAIVVTTTQNHGEKVRFLFRWDAAELDPFGTWESESSGGRISFSLLNDAYFVDLDGDGALEIVNPPEFEAYHPGDNEPEKPRQYDVYKIGAKGYEPAAVFEGFDQFLGGPPKPQANTFLASSPGAAYRMTIANGDGRDVPPVTGAEIRLNGELVAGPEKVNANHRYLTIPVPVQANNRIDVTCTGPKGSALYIGVGPGKPARHGGQ